MWVRRNFTHSTVYAVLYNYLTILKKYTKSSSLRGSFHLHPLGFNLSYLPKSWRHYLD